MDETLEKIFRTHKKISGIAFLLVFAVVLFSYAGFQQNNISNMRFLMSESEKIAVDAQANKIEEELNNIDNDLDFLSASPAFKKYVNGQGTKDSLEEEWVVFVNSMKKYDKLRYIDWHGDEIVRINFNNGFAQKVDDALLQNQSNKYYFIEAFTHSAGERYISKIDLNTEGSGESSVNGLPYKPVIRAAITVFDAKNRKQGIILLDYLGQDAINGVKKASTNIRHIQLVNGNGEFLAGQKKEQERDYSHPEQSDQSFKDYFPEEWERIRNIKNGQFFNNTGIFTFRALKTTNVVHRVVNEEDNLAEKQLGKPSGFIISQISAASVPFASDSNGYLLSLVNVFHTPLLLLGMIFFSLLFTILVATYQEHREKTRVMLTYDKLTGCFNRTFGMAVIEKEIKSAERYNHSLSLLMLDIDNFKKVNDSFGHLVGDIVLKSIAGIVGGLVRKTDSVIRLGGEEFLIVLPETDVVAAVKVAEKIRNVLEEHLHPIAGKVTVSFGVSERMLNEIFPRWYDRTDAALYQAKKAGRNRVVAASNKYSSDFAPIKLEWNSEWESGNREIDAQHRKLLLLGNKLIDMSISKVTNDLMIKNLDLLVEEVTAHFAHEEQILAKLDYPQYEVHANIHKGLIVKAKYLKETYSAGEVKPADLFSFIVSELVLEHMLIEDVKFFSFLKNKELKNK